MTCQGGIDRVRSGYCICDKCHGRGCATNTMQRLQELNKLNGMVIAKLLEEKHTLVTGIKMLGGEWDGRTVKRMLETNP